MVDCYRPQNLREALEIRNNKKPVVFAGGTDLMVRMKNWAGLPPKFESDVLFIGHLEELRNIEYKNSCLKIGAACTLAQIIQNEFAPNYMKDILLNMASPAVRNIATLGGNICNSSPAGDTLPVLYALNAKLSLESLDGNREISIEDFIYGPGKNQLRGDELLKEISIEIKPFDFVFHKKIGTRKASSISKASFIGLANIKDSKIDDIRISFGAVAKTVIRSRVIEDKLKGLAHRDIEESLLKIKEQYSGIINSIDDQRSSKIYREDVSIKLLEKFLLYEIK